MMVVVTGKWMGVGVLLNLNVDGTFSASGAVFNRKLNGTYRLVDTAIELSPRITQLERATLDCGRILFELRDIGCIVLHREQRPDFPSRLTWHDKTTDSVRMAEKYAAICRHFFVESFHLFAGCLTMLADELPWSAELFAKENMVRAICNVQPRSAPKAFFGRIDQSEQCDEAMFVAARLASQRGMDLIAPEMILSGLLGLHLDQDSRFLSAIPLSLNAVEAYFSSR